MKYPAFLGPSNVTQSLTFDAERTINFYPEKSQSQGSTSEWVLLPTPGVEEIADGGAGPGRAHYYNDGQEYAVIGTTFYEIAQDGTLTNRGTVAIDQYPATISSNGDAGGQIFITSGRNGYIYDINTTVFSQVAALNGKAFMGAMLDGFFLALDNLTSTFYFSNLLDGLTWTTGTNFAQRSDAPDPWQALYVVGQFIWLLGTKTSGAWYNTGGQFPFALHPSGRIPYGTAAEFSGAVLGRDFLWLGANRDGRAMVLKTTGFTPEVISTYAIQNQITDYSTIADALGDSYSDRGHSFYLLSFPDQDVTLCYDTETQLWTERGTWLAEENRYQVWRPRWHAFAFGDHRMLDGETGAVYEMNQNLTLDVDERPIRRLRRAPALNNELNRIFYSRFELDFEPGLGTSGQGEDPQIMMRFSDDGGRTWSSERWRSAGLMGEYGRRAEWWRLGSGRRRVFEIAFSDPTPLRITDAYLEVEQEAA